MDIQAGQDKKGGRKGLGPFGFALLISYLCASATRDICPLRTRALIAAVRGGFCAVGGEQSRLRGAGLSWQGVDMSGSHSKSKPLWEDKFHVPRLEALLGELSRQQLTWAEHIRTTLGQVPGMEEQLKWEGVAWRWSLSFVNGETNRALCYLVPQPGHPKLVVLLPLDLLSTIESSSVPKWLREGVFQSPLVGRMRWTTWELSSKSQIDELLELVLMQVPAAAARGT